MCARAARAAAAVDSGLAFFGRVGVRAIGNHLGAHEEILIGKRVAGLGADHFLEHGRLFADARAEELDAITHALLGQDLHAITRVAAVKGMQLDAAASVELAGFDRGEDGLRLKFAGRDLNPAASRVGLAQPHVVVVVRVISGDAEHQRESLARRSVVDEVPHGLGGGVVLVAAVIH